MTWSVCRRRGIRPTRRRCLGPCQAATQDASGSVMMRAISDQIGALLLCGSIDATATDGARRGAAARAGAGATGQAAGTRQPRQRPMTSESDIPGTTISLEDPVTLGNKDPPRYWVDADWSASTCGAAECARVFGGSPPRDGPFGCALGLAGNGVTAERVARGTSL